MIHFIFFFLFLINIFSIPPFFKKIIPNIKNDNLNPFSYLLFQTSHTPIDRSQLQQRLLISSNQLKQSPSFQLQRHRQLQQNQSSILDDTIQYINQCHIGQPIVIKALLDNQPIQITQVCYCPFDYAGEHCDIHISPICKIIQIDNNTFLPNISTDYSQFMFRLECVDPSNQLKREGVKLKNQQYAYLKNATNITYFNREGLQIQPNNDKSILFNYKNHTPIFKFTNSKFKVVAKTINWFSNQLSRIFQQYYLSIQEISGIPFRISYLVESLKDAQIFDTIYIEINIYQQCQDKQIPIILKSYRFQIQDDSYIMPNANNNEYSLWSKVLIYSGITLVIVLLFFFLYRCFVKKTSKT